MKKLILLLLLLPFTGSVFCQITKNGSNSRGYFRLGINQLGKDLSTDLSPKENALDGRFGAKTGYSLEFGRNFYFNKNSLLPVIPTKIGLDWTSLALNYSQLDWASYAEQTISGDDALDSDSKFHAFSLSTRLGPVISINPIEKLVIDIRGQLDLSYYFNTLDYYVYNNVSGNETYVSFVPENDDEDDESIFSKGSLGLRPNFGITIRRKAIGLSADWTSGKLKKKYDSSEGSGEEKIQTNIVSFKLSFTL